MAATAKVITIIKLTATATTAIMGTTTVGPRASDIPIGNATDITARADIGITDADPSCKKNTSITTISVRNRDPSRKVASNSFSH